MRERLGDQAGVGSLLSNLALVAEIRGRHRTAQTMNERALAIREEVGDKWAICVSQNNLGMIALMRHDFAEAQTRFESSMRLATEIGDRWVVAVGHHNLGNALLGSAAGRGGRATSSSRLCRRTRTTATPGRCPTGGRRDPAGRSPRASSCKPLSCSGQRTPSAIASRHRARLRSRQRSRQRSLRHGFSLGDEEQAAQRPRARSRAGCGWHIAQRGGTFGHVSSTRAATSVALNCIGRMRSHVAR